MLSLRRRARAHPHWGSCTQLLCAPELLYASLAGSVCHASSAGCTRSSRTSALDMELIPSACQGARGGAAAGAVEYRYLTEFQSHEPEVRLCAAAAV